MTKLTKPVRRQIEQADVVVTLAPEGIYVRQRGKRTTYGPLAYGRLYTQLGRERADEILRARKAARQRSA